MKIPQLQKKLEVKSCHDTTWEDNYSWIHQGNILEVLKDSSKLLPEVRKYLEDENNYFEHQMKNTKNCQKKLFDEIKELNKFVLSDKFKPTHPVANGAKFIIQRDMMIGHETQAEIIRKYPELLNNTQMRILSIQYKYSPMSVFNHPDKIKQEICDEAFAIYKSKGGKDVNQL